MPTLPTLSIVIPALNEEDGIQQVLTRTLAIRSALAAIGVDGPELIVVDDGSTDRTAAMVAATPGVRLVRHPRNRGYGAALKTGFAAANGDWIGFLDADGTYPPEYFPGLCQVGIEQHADLVIGSRMAGAQSQMPATRRLGNWLFANLLSLVGGQHITDSASGMRIFRKEILERLYPLPDGLNLTPVMSTRAIHENLTMVELPIPYAERQGRSKLSVVRDGWRFAQSIIWTALAYNPARLLGISALVALGLAAAIALTLLFVRLTGVTTLGAAGAFAVFLGMVAGVVGISLLGLGYSFNYFVALFHKRPVRQGLLGRPRRGLRVEQHLGSLGLLALGAGVVVGVGALLFGLAGVPVENLWLYYLGSAGLVLIGIQLMIAWVQMVVLEALSEREHLVRTDLAAQGEESAPEPAIAALVE